MIIIIINCMMSIAVVQNPSEQEIVQYFNPTPFDRSDTRVLVRDIGFGNQVVLWNIRWWVVHRQQGCSHRPITSMCAHIGMAEAMDVIDEMMTLLATLAMRPICIHGACSTTVSNDECLLLSALHELQKGEDQSAKHTMGRLFQGAMGCLFMRSASALVDCLDCADLRVNKIPHLHIV